MHSVTVKHNKVEHIACLRSPQEAKVKAISKNVSNVTLNKGLDYNISKNQLPRSKTVASRPKKVHFRNPICKASLAW